MSNPAWPGSAKISESARNWLILGVLGWFFGFMRITGPLAWYQANRFRREFESLGLAPSSDVQWLRLLGMITTILVAVVAAACVLVLLVVFVMLGTGGFHFG